MRGRPRAALWAIAAERIGCSLEEYSSNREAGRRWCWKCRRWRAAERFGDDKCRPEGRDGQCTECRIAQDEGRPRARHRRRREKYHQPPATLEHASD